MAPGRSSRPRPRTRPPDPERSPARCLPRPCQAPTVIHLDILLAPGNPPSEFHHHEAFHQRAGWTVNLVERLGVQDETTIGDQAGIRLMSRTSSGSARYFRTVSGDISRSAAMSAGTRSFPEGSANNRASARICSGCSTGSSWRTSRAIRPDTYDLRAHARPARPQGHRAAPFPMRRNHPWIRPGPATRQVRTLHLGNRDRWASMRPARRSSSRISAVASGAFPCSRSDGCGLSGPCTGLAPVSPADRKPDTGSDLGRGRNRRRARERSLPAARAGTAGRIH